MIGEPTQTRQDRRRRAWLGFGWFLLIGWIGLSVLPTPQLDILDRVDWSDKAAHAAAYAILMWWFAQAYARMRWPRIGCALLLLGIALECVQHLLPYRAAEAADIIANLVGIACGSAGAVVIRADIPATTP